MTSNNHYDILGVSQSATQEEIKAAFKSKALQWHPDKNLNQIEVATEMFKNIANAYDILSQPSTRHEYDASLLGVSTSSNASGYSQQRRDPTEEIRRAQDIFNHFFPEGIPGIKVTGGISISIKITSTTTFSSSNGRVRTTTVVRNANGTSVSAGGKSGAKQVKAVKSAKTTKAAKSSPASIPVVKVSDQTLASLISSGTLENKYTMQDIKEMLVERNLKKGGTKRELIERLDNYVTEQQQLTRQAQREQLRREQNQVQRETQVLQARIQSQQQAKEVQKTQQARLAQLQSQQRQRAREEQERLFFAKHSNKEAEEAQRKREEENRGYGWW